MAIFIANFENALPDNFDTWDTGSEMSTVAIPTGTGHAYGTNCLKVVGTAAKCYLTKSITVANTQTGLSIGFYLFVPSAITTGHSFNLFELTDTIGGDYLVGRVQLVRNPSNAFQLNGFMDDPYSNNGPYGGTIAPAVVINTWYWVECKFAWASSTAIVAWRITNVATSVVLASNSGGYNPAGNYPDNNLILSIDNTFPAVFTGMTFYMDYLTVVDGYTYMGQPGSSSVILTQFLPILKAN
jgi:hypothetical protein